MSHEVEIADKQLDIIAEIAEVISGVITSPFRSAERWDQRRIFRTMASGSKERGRHGRHSG
jgi:hypothetical protein